jgi:hypothetical protein
MFATTAQVKAVLPKFEGEPSPKTSVQYRLMPKSFFQKSRMQKILGMTIWPYSLGGSDCGCFAVRLCAELYERYANKFCQRGGSGGGDATGDGYDEGGEQPALLVAFVKYLRRDGQWHICLVTIPDPEISSKLVPYFFERTSRDLREVDLNHDEMESIKWIRSLS